ncbi:DUF5723 family protein [Lutibacter sp. TH_r2]|uniref:DUF5723 family protein n=1 Tax=Lutibacter sp. TH_r2 TaxID=3082083 RepID=UPI002953B964|nr:DUF5723 family protein [Lutibacter sp. TH_r2]MDV7185773.1 DUF5723 family protein [Lutibacter sp. TH_r2]
MRKLIIIWSLLVTTINYAQNKQLLYGFDELPQTLLLNPGAEVSYKTHVGMPLLSGIHLQGGFSGFSAYDIFKDDGVDVNIKIRNVVDQFGTQEFVSFNQQLEVINAGFRLPNNSYLSFGYYQETDFIGRIPKDMVDLFYHGNTIDKVYSFNKFGLRADVTGVLHVGISKKINNKWQVGARAKIYSGVANARAKIKSGDFYTENGNQNVYNHHLDNVDLYFQSSGIILDDYDDVETSFYTKKLLFGGNLGLGIDVGFTHHLTKHWEITGSVLDFGFISNSKETESYTVKGDYQIEGINLFFDENNPQDYWSDLEDDFNSKVVTDTIYSSYTSLKPIKFNGAITYSFGKPRTDDCRFQTEFNVFTNRLGFQLYSTLGEINSQIAATLFYERRINKNIRVKATYTADSFSYKNIGLGVSTKIGAFNSYLLVDNLLNMNNVYNAKSASIQAGINLIFNNKN